MPGERTPEPAHLLGSRRAASVPDTPEVQPWQET